MMSSFLEDTHLSAILPSSSFSETVRLEREGRLAVVVIDNPPVNAGSASVRSGIHAAVARVAADPDIDACVLMGAGGSFIAGSDIREFDQPLVDPQLPAVIAAIEACPKPVVAALDGAALGGGFEVALGCDMRIGTPRLMVGLPEVQLGIIPGAGGTQRLPRLAGMSAAIEMICSGRRVKAEEALRLGILDAVVEGDLRGAALDHASSLGGAKRRVRDAPLPADPVARVEKARQDALRQGRGRPVRDAIEAVGWAGMLGFDDALAKERELFQRLRTGEAAAALRHLFFAEREALKFPGLKDAAAHPLGRIGVLGAGTMGSGIASAVLAAGYQVVLIDPVPAALEAGLGRIRESEARQVAAGRLTVEQSRHHLDRLTAAGTVATLADAARPAVDMVIEAVFEDMQVKTEVMRQLGATLPGSAIIASNTSYLDLDALAEASGSPERVVGLHFFAPATLMRLLEVVKGRATGLGVLRTALDFARTLGKVPVISGVGDGFIGNRIYSAYRAQCEFMVEEGATPQEVDAAMEAFGFALGPFAVGDLSGLDIAWKNRRRLAATRDPAARYCAIPDRLCEAGRLGRKTGAGWYRYSADGRTRAPDPEVLQLIEEARAAAGIVPRAFSREDIQMRALAAIVNEGIGVLEAGIAQRTSDIDLVLVHGYGFPADRGGPLFWASRQPRARMLACMSDLAAKTGPGFRPADLDRWPLFSPT